MRWKRSALLVALLAIPWVARGGVKGDLNDDGRVDAADALLLIRIIEGDLDPGTLDPEDVADVAPIVSGVGGNDTVDSADALLMLRALQQDVDTDTLDTPGENAIGTSPFLADTDDDGHTDPIDPDPLATSPPFVPPHLRIFDGTGNVTLTWATPSGNVDHYIVHRFGNNGEYTYFSVDGNAETFVDTTAAPGTVHFYWVQAVSTPGLEAEFVDCSIAPGNARPWLTGALGPLPNPWFSVDIDGTTANLSWEQSTNSSVTGYRIYRSGTSVPLGGTGGLAPVHDALGLTTTSYSLPGLSSGTHYFRITAFNGSFEGLLESAKQVSVVVP